MFPDATRLRLEACALDDATAQSTLHVRSTQATAPCPLCTTPAHRIHSHSQRTLADLPWAHYRVRLPLHVPKWFCRTRHCPHRVCTERLPPVAAPWARRTRRLVQRLIALGIALGDQAGGRLGHAWDLRVSRKTLLRRRRRHPVPALPTPTVLGVDAFALRKGQTYGTGLIDLERRPPVALLPERTAETLTQWLQEPPGVQVSARDRARAYADGARQGAPAAPQVADRLHLLHHLAAALEPVLPQHRRVLQASHMPTAVSPLTLADPTAVIEAPSPAPTAQPAACLPPSAGASPRHPHRRLRYAQVGLHRKTVAPYVRSDSFPGRARPKSVLDPYTPYWLDCGKRGCRTGRRLYAEMQRQGYRGRRSTGLGYLTQLRKAQGRVPRTRTVQPRPPVPDPSWPCGTPRQATWLVLRQPAHLTAEDQAVLDRLRQAPPACAQVMALAQGLAPRLRARQPERLDRWLQQAATSPLAALRRLAKSGQRD